jgi:DNA-nicking Smr family endonuclease
MAKQRSTNHPGGAPTSEDALAFRAAVRDVKPLEQAPSPNGLAKVGPRARRRKPSAMADDIDVAMPLVDPMPVVEGSGERSAVSGADVLAFHRAGVRPQVVRQLRRGLFPIEDELDLHGLTQSVARDYLAQFLTQNRDAGRRCVRIIHGKGYRSGARGPILKIAVDLWLRRHMNVIAFTSARPIDGGTGAVYVLLRA